MIQMIVDNIKLVGSCCAGITGVCGGYVYFDGPVPVSHHYVAQLERSLKERVIEGQIQTNVIQRNLLKKEKLDRQIDLRKDPNSPAAGILNERLDRIDDELREIQKEGDELYNEKRGKR